MMRLKIPVVMMMNDGDDSVCFCVWFVLFCFGFFWGVGSNYVGIYARKSLCTITAPMGERVSTAARKYNFFQVFISSKEKTILVIR